ncbi:MAG: hypothetical protein F4234_06830 [Gammaproteobacteria bacterium]|nr:hypothetical protein [Gammaproteobacteria bacterium]MXY90487.1 hypothetical protein [Gammaproteobacteria bacterium]MYE99876.1 hypothetical protein [Gammaproteobacteria bacterium]MYG96939.1 hypothetical protein [Gammaproteobacteria bacterium]
MTTNSQTIPEKEQQPKKKFLGIPKEEWKIIGKEALTLLYIVTLGALIAICLLAKNGSKAEE